MGLGLEVDKGVYERAIAAKHRKAERIKHKLEKISKRLDFPEKVVFSSAYRIRHDVGQVSDYDFMDAAGNSAELQLNNFFDVLKRKKKKMTPSLLWRYVPLIDPHRIQRRDLAAKRVLATVIDFAGEKRVDTSKAA